MKKKMKQLASHEEDGATPTDHASLEPIAAALDEDTPMLDADADDEGEELGMTGHVPHQFSDGGGAGDDGISPHLKGEPPTSPPTTKAGKPKFCDNCGKELLARIQVCAGCKKVAYCNFRCQKASWKLHKKTCSYALRKDSKESTG